MKSTLISLLLFCCLAGLELAWADASVPFELPPKVELRKIRSAIVYTEYGEMHFALFPDLAPWHVANFKYRADRDLYRDVRFHIFEPDYLIQGGERDSSGNPGYSLPPEFSDLKHEPGTLAMARVPDRGNPERRSHGSQFYVSLGYPAHLNRHYTIFGKLTKGMDILKSLRKGDSIYDVKVFVRKK